MMLTFPPPLTPRSFLEQYWQKGPLFMPDGLPDMQSFIGAGEVAWLATQPDVEARLVFTERAAGGTRYRVRHGPFTERRLRRLPASDWTLLVHDVEKHLPELRAWIDAAPFVPDWRIDDLMVSVAAPGGSVGPHRDRYDVFLCQVSGRREWHLTEPGAAVPARRRGALALLEPFSATAPITASPSDVLYLPPSVPHWGIASDDCVTYSLGMRAPGRRELAEALGTIVPRETAHAPSLVQQDGDVLYTDPDLLPDESEPGMIDDRALERSARLLASPTLERRLLARALGTVVTTPKESLAPEPPEAHEIAQLMAQLGDVELTAVHGMARLAWWQPGRGHALVFVNGRARPATPEALVEFRHLCARRVLPAAACAKLSGNGGGREFLRWLIASGALDLPAAKCEM